MPYSEFTLPEVARRFSLTIKDDDDLFSSLVEVSPSALLQTILAENTPLALAMSTEKARSELLISPILIEVRRARAGKVSLFSGADFTVDAQAGLDGICDFLLTRSTQQLFIENPVAVIIEAKKEDIVGGMGQCIAAMIAAQRFNARYAAPEETPTTIYGAVTTGDIWKFLKLEGTTASVDAHTYYLDAIGTILSILLKAVG